MIKSYKELDVYQKAFEISLIIHRASIEFPQHEQFALTSQIRRASKSICANVAEGFAKQKSSKAEFKRYLMIAFGSCNEMLVWIDYCLHLKYVSEEEAMNWTDAYEHISRMPYLLHEKISPIESSSPRVLQSSKKA